MVLNKDNVCNYLYSIGFRDSKIISIRNLRNFCAKISTNKGLILVKQEGKNHSTFSQVSIKNELLFYKLKESILSEVVHIAPRTHHINFEHKILVIEFLDNYKNFHLDEIDKDSKNYKTSYELGLQLFTLHNTPVDLCREFGNSDTDIYFRSFDVITPESYNSGGPLYAKFLQLMQRYPDLNEGIENFRKEFKWDCFIHGDLKLDNILFTNRDNKDSVKFIDWELAGIGDKYLDLGYIVGNYFLWWVEKMKFSELNSISNDEQMTIVKEHIYYFLTGYQSKSKNNHELNYIKITRFASIFLLNVFYSKSLFKNKYAKQDVMILEIARKMLVNTEAVYRELFMKTIMNSYEKFF